MDGTELIERFIKDLSYAIEKQSPLGDVGKAALSVISDRVRVIMETVNNTGQLIEFDANDLSKVLKDTEENKIEVANRIDKVLENESLVSKTLKSPDGKDIPIKDIVIKQFDFLHQTFGAKGAK